MDSYRILLCLAFSYNIKFIRPVCFSLYILLLNYNPSLQCVTVLSTLVFIICVQKLFIFPYKGRELIAHCDHDGL